MMPRALILGLLLFAAPALHAGEVLDRIAATVNGHAILQSDWQDEVRYECFASGRSPQDLTVQDRKAALDRLIDQELLREQNGAAEIKPPSQEEIERQLEAMKNDQARNHPSQAWSSVLSTYRLSESGIRNQIALELTQLRLVDAHLRPSIQVDAAAVAAYYHDHLEQQGAAGQQVSLQQAAPGIRELLTQQRMNQLLVSWLEGLRSQAQIRLFVPDTADAPGQGQ